jgi:flagellin
MGLRINQNIMAFSAYRNLSVTDGQLAKSLEKLSSGYRINRAADDASGLVISENLRSQVSGLRTATRNAQDGISVVQTAEGALNEVHTVLQRMRDLAVQAANTGTNDTASRNAAQNEVAALKSELDRIASSTRFGNINLLDGTFGSQYATTAGSQLDMGTGITVDATHNEISVTNGAGTSAVTFTAGVYKTASSLQTALQNGLDAAGLNDVRAQVTDTNGVVKVQFTSNSAFTLAAGASNDVLGDLGVSAGAAGSVGSGGVFQVGANNASTDQISIAISGVSSSLLGVNSVDVSTNAAPAITAIDAAISSVSVIRGQLGAFQNRFEHTIANLNVATENLAASESRIRDTDMALEMVSFTRHQILLQAGTAMLGQANQSPQSVLRLLQQ